MTAAGDAAVERAEDRVERLLRAFEAVLALGDLHRQRPHDGRAQRLAIVDPLAHVQAGILDRSRRRLQQRERPARVGQREDQRAALVEEGAVERPVAVERGLAALVRIQHEGHLAPVRELARGEREGGLDEAEERFSQLPVEHAGGRDEDAVHADAVRARGARSCRAPHAQEVEAREPRPLAVGRQQLGGVLRLGAPAEHDAAELDQPEVADEPAVVAAEAVQEERADRPGPELALAPESRRHSVGRGRAQPLELEQRGDAHERGGAPGRQARGAHLGGREQRELGSLGREPKAGVRAARRGRRCRARCGAPRERDELTGQRLDQRMQARPGPRRAQTARARHRRGQQRVACGQREEG